MDSPTVRVELSVEKTTSPLRIPPPNIMIPMPHLTALDDNFAFQVEDFDIWAGLDDAQVRILDDAWANQGVLVFRRQALTEFELVAFSKRFGAPDVIVRTDWSSASNPEIIQISNMRNAKGETIGGLGSGELAWHTDQAYMAKPATGAILYGVEVPEGGPRTYWANLRLAYDALPSDTKARIEGRRAIFRYAERYKDYQDETVPSEEILAKTPEVTHALVQTHPVSGARTLYMDPSTMVGIEGMDQPEARFLLDDLIRHSTRPEFVYSHDWRPGDLIMWDNGFMLHRRDAFRTDQNRLLKRTTIRLSPDRHIIPR